jgi:hypothetical protein
VIAAKMRNWAVLKESVGNMPGKQVVSMYFTGL